MKINIKEVAKTMTREDFLEEAMRYNFGKLNSENDCPGCYGLKEIELCKISCENCKECWSKAVKDIKFKDDIEVKKLSKELNILQAMSMPIGTEFEVIYEDGFEFDDGNIVQLISGLRGDIIVWKNDQEEVICGKDFINAKFIPIQKPVSFMEAIRAYSKGKTIEVNTETYSTLYKPDERNSMGVELLDKDGEVINLKEILEGKWYIHEDNAND